MSDDARLARLSRLHIGERCPVKGCGTKIRRRMLMCAAHWREVPAPLKREVYDSARALHRDLLDEGAYKAWLDDALAAIEAVEAA